MRNRINNSLVLIGLTLLVLLLIMGCHRGLPTMPPLAKCKVPPMPSYSSLPSTPKLPDPFKFMNGKRMKSKREWPCRRKEIATLAQEFEYGYKPNTPYSATSAILKDDTTILKGDTIINPVISVNVTKDGKKISFDCPITYPSGGSRPYPAMIGIGFTSINRDALLNLGVAIIRFPNSQIAQQINADSRGKGLFYDLFGSDNSASATMAWAWGVSRLIDALEKTPDADIDPKRLGVTGCSRNGKGALVAGAFDKRIKLTIPQEPGAGGAASWRISDAQLAAGKTVQTLAEIVNENVWFRESFSQFSHSSDKLPFDQHSIMALVAPRALLVIENTSIEWLSPFSSWVSAHAAHKVWEALGIPGRMGFSQVGNHPHCAMPSSQLPDVTAYVNKFLIGGGTGKTNIMKSDGGFEFDEEDWIDWEAPSLR